MSQLSEWGSGMSFVRELDDGASYAVVGLAIGSDQDVAVSPVRNGPYRDAVSGREVRVDGGQLSFRVRANSAGIYVLNGPGKIGEDEIYLR